MEEILGALMLGAIGAFFRRLFINATKTQGEKKVTFDVVYRGPKGMSKVDRFVYQLQNNLIGFIVVGIVLFLLLKVFR
jgi:hypothetical protein